MKQFTLLTLLSIALLGFMACNEAEKTEQEALSSVGYAEGEKPVQHINLPDITTKDEAVDVMESTTDQLKAKEKLDAIELNDIHVITYSLEKAIAYFAENTTGEQQKVAEEMAVVVEEVHLNSENNRPEETKMALDRYYELAEEFSKSIK